MATTRLEELLKTLGNFFYKPIDKEKQKTGMQLYFEIDKMIQEGNYFKKKEKYEKKNNQQQ